MKGNIHCTLLRLNLSPSSLHILPVRAKISWKYLYYSCILQQWFQPPICPHRRRSSSGTKCFHPGSQDTGSICRDLNRTHRRLSGASCWHQKLIQTHCWKHWDSLVILHQSVVVGQFNLYQCICHGSVSYCVFCFDFHALLCHFSVSCVLPFMFSPCCCIFISLCHFDFSMLTSTRHHHKQKGTSDDLQD